METIRNIRPIVTENFEQVSIKDLEFSSQKSLMQNTYVKSYQMDSDKVQQRISDAISRFIESNDIHLDCEVDIEKGLILMKAISKITGEVIKEVLPKTILYTNENLKVMTGILLDRKV
jgi:uncharacterized FlaG/YvyC family protein